MNVNVNVHPLTNHPTSAWEQLSKTQKVVKIHSKTPTKPVGPDKVRIVCMSDTHSLTSHIRFNVPEGDVFIHAGDFTSCGEEEEVEEFNEWLGKLPHKYKIVVAGNHELSFDSNFAPMAPLSPRAGHGEHNIDNIPTLGFPRNKLANAVNSRNTKEKLTNCIYLQDSEVVLYNIKFYGSPWQPKFQNWAFNLPRGESCLKKWEMIPVDTDVLITHTPPLGYGDLCCTQVRAGCAELLSTVQQRVQPKYHVFGHIHEGYGITSDGKTIFVNASTCDILYQPNNPPIVFDIKLPKGVTK